MPESRASDWLCCWSGTVPVDDRTMLAIDIEVYGEQKGIARFESYARERDRIPEAMEARGLAAKFYDEVHFYVDWDRLSAEKAVDRVIRQQGKSHSAQEKADAYLAGQRPESMPVPPRSWWRFW